MKKIITLCLTALISLAALAQTEPNRLIINKANSQKAFDVTRIDSITFATQEGKIAADVKYLNYNSGDSGDTIWVAITKTPACKAYRFACIPKNIADRIADDVTAESYFDHVAGSMQSEDFTNAQMTGFDMPFKASTSYAIITLGYDQYGVAGSMSKAEFTTPDKPLVGNPEIKGEVTEITPMTITAKFTPNADVMGYAYVIFEKGIAEQQFQQFGPMMGFSNMGDMIKAWGVKSNAEATYTWEKMIPGTEYEIYVQAWDNNETYIPMVIIPVTTKKLGGEGTAEVSIEIKEFGKSNEQHYQRVVYTPNDQCSLHRDIIITKEGFDKADMGEEGVKKMLMEDNPNDPYWNQYGVDNATWNADPSTTYYACSMAKNINDQWGPLTKVEFTTPATAGAKATKAKAVPSRMEKNSGAGVFKAPFMLRNAAKPVMKLEQK
ncbi:hypothetical protein [Prevotella dentasini]|uniref:hypothetical protein n=1 Tax=Prevotella dentasini TaxID=589537 RepID=UPI00046B07A6|nr:hypothetical protein [Prevotella dentasini]